jgi:6-pyruvoyltetrahydropterin/6-carboxytetrahydropterin synthase
MTNKIQVTRRFEFDAAHRLPDHPGKCRRLHGHRYAADVTLRYKYGSLQVDDRGMVTDFGDMKRVIGEWIDRELDHKTVLAGDPNRMPGTLDAAEEDLAVACRKSGGDDAVAVCPFGPPTAENMAEWIMSELSLVVVTKLQGTEVIAVRLYETPSCWAEVCRT